MGLPALVAQAPGLERFGSARSSDEFVVQMGQLQQRLGGRKMSMREKQVRMAHMLRDANTGMLRLGQSMIGPIQLQLRYQGILRNVLLEDTLTPGVPIQYDILDQLGQAYVLHGNEGEIRITPFEGKRVEVQLFRIATFPIIRKEDLYFLRANLVEYQQDFSKQAIMRQEDGRLVSLIETAVAQYRLVDSSAQPAVGSNPGGSLPNEISVAGDILAPDDLYNAVTYTDQRMLDSTRLLVNPKEYRDFYRWDINTTGWAFKDSVVAGERIVQFGEFQIGKSIIIPIGTTYLTPDPEFLGVFPVMYSLDVEENNLVQQFHKGWVMDELVGMAILNPRGLIILRKQ